MTARPRRRALAAAVRVARVDGVEPLRLVARTVGLALLGAVSGVLAGVSSAAFLGSLEWVTEVHASHPWLLLLLPVAGLAVGAVYQRAAGASAAGNNLILDEIHAPSAWVPRRMAPLVLGATLVTHLFGGSAGREGTAIQMSGSLTDVANRVLRLGPQPRRLLLIAAIAGGFGAVFGVPVAGAVFALEVQSAGRVRHDAIVPALSASVVGDRVVRALGVEHTRIPVIAAPDLSPAVLLKCFAFGVACGLVALAFSELVHGTKALFRSAVRTPAIRPAIGGILVIGLALAVDSREYLGLSLPLIERSLAGGAGVAGGAFVLKLAFTVLTLGSGFQGGEVTPLFVIGATLGVALAGPLGLPATLAAALGFVAVFAGATKTPIACTVMGAELFGATLIVPLAIACVVAYVCSADRGIYTSQRIAADRHALTARSRRAPGPP